MSWFAKDVHSLLDDGDNFTATDETLDVEIADGVVIERRSVLWLSAAAVASVLTGGSLTAGNASGQGKQQRDKKSAPEDGTSFEHFLESIYPKAKSLIAAGGVGEEAYLFSVAAAMSTLKKPDGPIHRQMRAFRKQHGKTGKRFPIAAMQIRLNRGGALSHHDHLDYNGVILGLDGEIRVRNYDFVGADQNPAKGKTFQIRETRDDLILPGRFSTLGRQRENIHELVAGENGGRVLDLFTFFDKRATSRWLNVEAKPRDAAKRIYDAAWR